MNFDKAWAASAGQFIRYALVGAIANGAGYFLYLELVWSGQDPKVAATVSFAAVLLIGFALNRRWTFQVSHFSFNSLIRYVLAYLAAYLLNIFGLYYLVDVIGLQPEMIQAILIVVIAMALFAVQKLWVFWEVRERSASDEAAPNGGV